MVAGRAILSATTKNEVTLTLTPLDSVEQYNPATAVFTTLSNTMTAPRRGCTATLLDNGTVLIAGGLNSSGEPQNTGEIYDPTAGTFTATTGSMNFARAYHTATLLTSGPAAGEVLITGGLNNNTPGSPSDGLTLKTAELYNPSTGTFALLSSQMSDFRAFHSATILPDGTILITGGDSDGFPGFAFGATQAADIFDPTTETFTPTAGQMQEPLLLQGATLLNDGTLLISGGFDAGQIVITTGRSLTGFFGSVAQGAEIYSPTTGQFACLGGTTTIKKTGQTACATKMKHPHAGHAAVLLNDGTVLIAGGFGGGKDTSNANTTNEAEIYNASTQKFTKVGAMKTGVALGAAALIEGPPA